jgi:adenylate kinase
MRIIITGTPGTGKSEVAEELARLTGEGIFDIRDFANAHGIYTKSKSGEKIVDTKKLKSQLVPMLKHIGNYIAEGHLACEIKLPTDFIIVLRTNPAELKKRLAKRHYPKEKIDENLEAEMLDYCTQRVEQIYKLTPLELDTTKRTAKQSALEIEKAIKQKKKKLDVVNYTQDLEKYLRLRK